MDPKNLIPADTLNRAKALRKSSSPAEIQLWSRLRNRQLGGFKFRRQQPVAPFIADFYCVEAQVVIEIDGDSHAGQEQYDAARSRKIERDGLLVLRFTNADVSGNLNGVLDVILATCEERIKRRK